VQQVVSDVCVCVLLCSHQLRMQQLNQQQLVNSPASAAAAAGFVSVTVSSYIFSFVCLPLLTTRGLIYKISYDNAKFFMIDLRRTSNLQSILRRTQGFS